MRTCPLCSKSIAVGASTINFITNEEKTIACCTMCGNYIKIASESNNLTSVREAFSYLSALEGQTENDEAENFLQEVVVECAAFLSQQNHPTPSNNPAKYCSECGKPMNVQDTTCPSCGYSESYSAQSDETISTDTVAPIEKEKKKNSTRIVRVIAFCIMAISILISFETAADLIAKGGDGISTITSVGGRTLDEAYYYELGFIYEGYALIVKAVGRVFAALLVWVGVKK